MKKNNKYLRIEYQGLVIGVKSDDEGIILDVWKEGEIVATTWKTYNESGIVVEHESS